MRSPLIVQDKEAMTQKIHANKHASFRPEDLLAMMVAGNKSTMLPNCNNMGNAWMNVMPRHSQRLEPTVQCVQKYMLIAQKEVDMILQTNASRHARSRAPMMKMEHQIKYAHINAKKK